MADLVRFDVLAEWRNTGGTVLSVWCNAPRCIWFHQWPPTADYGTEGRADILSILQAIEQHPPAGCPKLT